MRLSLLSPVWLGADGRERLGFVFRCPVCLSEEHGQGLGHYVTVWLANPPDGGAPAPSTYVPSVRHEHTGGDFDTITLGSVVHASCGWIGAIWEGETERCSSKD